MDRMSRLLVKHRRPDQPCKVVIADRVLAVILTLPMLVTGLLFVGIAVDRIAGPTSIRASGWVGDVTFGVCYRVFATVLSSVPLYAIVAGVAWNCGVAAGSRWSSQLVGYAAIAWPVCAVLGGLGLVFL